MESRRIEKDVVVPASRAAVWRAWSTAEGARSFLAPWARIGSRPGEPYEVLFDPDDTTMGTRGLKLLSLVPGEMISFEWNAPPDFPDERARPTWVVVLLDGLSDRETHVRLLHLGWREGGRWDEVYAYFEQAWDIVVGRLVHRFEAGPIDWSVPFVPPRR